MKRPRILLADDHKIMAQTLKSLLVPNFDVVATAEDGLTLVRMANELAPDVIVADITMPNINGIEAVSRLKRDNPEVKVVFLTMHQNPAYARRALEAGAVGFVIKHSAPDELVMAIHAALRGKTFIAPALAGDVLQEMQHGAKQEAEGSITPRQREILQLLVEGRSAKEIAEALSISARTVEFHKYHMMEAHGLHSTAELIHFAIKHGIATI